MRFSLCALLLATAGAASGWGQSRASAPSPEIAVGNPLALTFYVAPKFPNRAEARAKSIQTPGSPDFHRFFTVSEFVNHYAASDKDIAAIESSLEQLGFRIAYVFPNHLGIQVLGTVGTAQKALGTKLARTTINGKTGFAAQTPITLPKQLQGVVRAVGGLDTVHVAHPNRMESKLNHGIRPRAIPSLLEGGTPGTYLPADFVKNYHVDPLYHDGLTGAGKTIGIVTLNTFNPADAYLFWDAIGLKVSQKRISIVDVDGGTEATTNNNDGEGETDLDVEYSGAIAPEAHVRVYVGPNNGFGFLDAFEVAASENVADTISTSWGGPELDYFAAPGDPSSNGTGILNSYHDAFLEMAIQGQTVYAASGDSGSFDTVRGCPAFGNPSPLFPVCNAPYAVDMPANDPLVTAAGGTTLPFSAQIGSLSLKVNHERAWAWDYIATQAADQGLGSIYPLSSFFSVGGGGGVSSYFARPWYQQHVDGVRKTEPGQYFAADFGSGSVVQKILPSKFAGRNLPDISADADPESGYQYVQGGYLFRFNGGTSFVAPQLNGVTALLSQGLGSRIGQINPALYQLGAAATSKLNRGDNWGYAAEKGFDDASGLGTLDACKLLKELKKLN